jgi:uncharacterized protein DUF4760
MPVASEAATGIVAASAFWRVQPLVTAVAAILSLQSWVGSSRGANRSIARTRATLDLIERTESQAHYQSLWLNFKAVRGREGGFGALIAPATPADETARALALEFLNHYELVAVGCKHGVLDSEFYKHFMRGAVVRDWQAASDFINAIRHPPGAPARPRLFEHLDALAQKWQAEIEIEQPFAPQTIQVWRVWLRIIRLRGED